MLLAAKKLLEKGVQSIAVVALFDDPDESDGYSKGEAVDVVGGIEAVISHYLSSELNVPVAHAPAFLNNEISCELVDKRAAAEYITPTFLPCVLLGLQNAPLLTNDKNEGFWIKDLNALVMPYDCLGSSIVFDAIKEGISVYAILENSTILNIDKKALNLQNNVEEVKDYSTCLNLIKN